MDNYNVTKASLTTNVVTLTLDTIVGLRPGYTVHVYGVDTQAQPHFDGNQTLTAVTTTTVDGVDVYTVTYAKTHANIAEFTSYGQMRIRCTWIDDADVEDWLGGQPDDAIDQDYLTTCVEAANAWCYARRFSAGYQDWPTHLPNDSVRQGAVTLAAALYRERGSVDSFSSFQQMPVVAPLAGSLGQVMRLLGIGRAAVA